MVSTNDVSPLELTLITDMINAPQHKTGCGYPIKKDGTRGSAARVSYFQVCWFGDPEPSDIARIRYVEQFDRDGNITDKWIDQVERGPSAGEDD